MAARIGVIAAVGLVALTVAPVAPAEADTAGDRTGLAPGALEDAEAAAVRPPSPRRGERQPVPEDRYAAAGGCYRLWSARTGQVLGADGDALRADGTTDPLAFHLEPTALGRYLLLTADGRVLGTPEAALSQVAGGVTDSSPGALVEGLTRGLTDDLLGDLADLGDETVADVTGSDATVALVDEPSQLTDWQLLDDVTVDGSDAFRLQLTEGAALAFDAGGVPILASPGLLGAAEVVQLQLADGCTAFPDAQINVSGPVVGGETPYGPVRGYVDPHVHGMAFEFIGGRARCGQPWHPYGVEAALQGCPEHDLLDGRTHVLETFLSGRDPVAGHDTVGWPTFVDWPAHDSLTYEQTYHRWIERSWRGGLRMMTVLLVDNGVLCDLYPFKENSCDEMDAVRLQAQRLREFEAYIDAQHGGPGHGWFRIVEDPFEARRVMNAGDLAVVMGIEISTLFGCTITAGHPQCDTDDIDRQLQEVHDLGVRQMEIVNKSDNALGGVAGDAGTTGGLTNAANLLETGSFLRMGSCEGLPQGATDPQQLNAGDDVPGASEVIERDAIFGLALEEVGGTGALPVYGPGPHCNERGLTDLGAYVIERMAERGMLFDPDHLSARARQDAMSLIEDSGYSGILSTHSWSDDDVYERILRAGGMVTPMARHSDTFVAEWEKHREWADDRFLFGFGFGSDVNGFAAQGAPRGSDAPNAVSYPFAGFGGTTIDRQVSGDRVFDINTDGVAHYGLYPDWVEDLRRQAGDAIVDDLERGPEAYLQTWERAVGVAPDSCRDDVAPLRREVFGDVEGYAAEQLLVVLGQPRSRDGAAFAYCVERGTATVRFDGDGRAADVRIDADRAPERHAGAAEVSADDRALTAAVREATVPDPSRDDVEVVEHDGHTHAVPAVTTLDATTVGAQTGDHRTAVLQVALVLLGIVALSVHRLARRGRTTGG